MKRHLSAVLAIVPLLPLFVPCAGCNTTPKRAEERQRRAVELHRDGVGALQAGRPSVALERFRAAFELQEGYLPCRRDLGVLAFQLAQKHEEDAMQAEEAARAWKDQGESEKAMRAGERFQKAHREALPLLDEAVRHLNVVNQAFPGDPQVLASLGRAYVYREEFREALRYFVEGASLATDDGWRARFEAYIAICEQELATR